ncbi:MAG: DNA polymerase IV [Ruminococcaceae bacterium]|nr:DNA polymerase IV [Oscillospiraceae bacterium]
MDRTILHCDLNNFYASVECLDHPEWREIPMAVCGSVEKRHGIVLAKNQPAKRYGVKTAEPVWQAKQKCPGLLTVPPHHDKYVMYSRIVQEIYACYTDMIEPFGIDESWLDVTGSRRLFGDGETIAHELRERVKRETGLTISVGVSFNKIFAKLGSDMKKPDAVTSIARESFRERIWNLPLDTMLGAGPSVCRNLDVVGIHTIGQLACADVEMLKYRLGKGGMVLWRYANGLDESPVSGEEGPIKSVGHGVTTAKDLTDNAQVWRVMLELSQDVARRLREKRLMAEGIQISVRDDRLVTRQFQEMLGEATANARVLCGAAHALFTRQYKWERNIRSVTVRAIHLTSADEPQQLDILCDYRRREKTERLDNAADALRRKYGRKCVTCAALLQPLQLVENGISAGED